jgi:hypothetical protein
MKLSVEKWETLQQPRKQDFAQGKNDYNFNFDFILENRLF